MARFIDQMIKLQNIGGKEYIFDKYKRNMESAMNNDYWQKNLNRIYDLVLNIVRLCFRLNIFCAN